MTYNYCACGYPFLLSAKWDGTDYFLVLLDGKRGVGGLPIIHCPQCGQGLVLEELDKRASTILEWHPRSVAAPQAASEDDTERTG